jgi:MFS family permease
MALSILLPNPFPYLFFFWSINAVSVIVTSAQQPAILRRHVDPHAFPAIFSRNKIIGIVIVTIGSFAIGSTLDSTESYFPYNYVFFMLIACFSTFAGMALIAKLAPREKIKIKYRLAWPFRECSRTMWWMALNNMGITMAIPLFVIYHVKLLQFNNTQIAYFIVAAGVVSAITLPLARHLMASKGLMKVYSFAIIGMAIVILPYGFVYSFWALLALQVLNGMLMAVHEVALQSVMMDDAPNHKHEMAYFSDFQLIMHIGNAIGPLLAAALLIALPLWGCFAVIALLRLTFYYSKRLTQPNLRHGNREITANSRELPHD